MRPNTGCCELVPNCKWSLLGSLPATGGMGPKWPAMPTESLRIELNMIMQVGHFCDVRVMLMTLLVLLETQAVVAEVVVTIVSNSAVIIDSWLRVVNVRKQS